MDKQHLLDVIQKTDIDLKLRQNTFNTEFETNAEIDVARQLLRKIKSGVLAGDQTMMLGDSWSFAALRLIMPLISAVERHGISVLYLPPGDPVSETSGIDVDAKV